MHQHQGQGPSPAWHNPWCPGTHSLCGGDTQTVQTQESSGDKGTHLEEGSQKELWRQGKVLDTKGRTRGHLFLTQQWDSGR